MDQKKPDHQSFLRETQKFLIKEGNEYTLCQIEKVFVEGKERSHLVRVKKDTPMVNKV